MLCLEKNNIFAENWMLMPYNLPQRKSPRAKWHDYNGANYFITICTKHHDLYFGDVVDGRMELSEIGEWTWQCAGKIETINDNVFVPEFVVMPNHVHLIVIMDNVPEWSDDQRLPRCDSPTTLMGNDVPDGGFVGLPYYDSRIENVPEINEEMQSRANRCGRLSHMIGQFKSAVTKYANQHEIPFAWQPRFHDHIIRNGVEMNRIADYIQNNPMNWELDRFYKKR
jgi:REP element-mobilizing transposase RayT